MSRLEVKRGETLLQALERTRVERDVLGKVLMLIEDQPLQVPGCMPLDGAEMRAVLLARITRLKAQLDREPRRGANA